MTCSEPHGDVRPDKARAATRITLLLTVALAVGTGCSPDMGSNDSYLPSAAEPSGHDFSLGSEATVATASNAAMCSISRSALVRFGCSTTARSPGPWSCN